MHDQLPNLKAGDVVHGFEILEVAEYGELKAGEQGTAYGIFARHRRSGAEVFHIFNGDEENLFAFAFGTAVRNSTGVAHIIEHTVLCGSEKFPLKDAFLVLCQGSLQTYLNAWTFPYKTVYPASSVNEADYFNLMAVYADAVFCPKLDEWAFMQEGHRLEYAENGRLVSTGVVFNEMKGAYSSLDEYADRWAYQSVLPDTPYAFDAGGDPAVIPDLTYQQFRDFHRERYSPANCKVFLAGNIPTEKQLAFLDEHYFARLPAGTAFPPVDRAVRWNERRALTVPSPAGADEKATVFLSWLCPPGNALDTLALQVLTEILLGHAGSPLSRILIQSGLGEDLASCCGIDIELGETVISMGLRGVDKKKALSAEINNNAIAVLIESKLQELVSGGIAPEDIEAALLALEFSLREVRRANGPYSLVWLRRALRSWLRGGHPADNLLMTARWAELKDCIAADPRYFEKLIEKALLQNRHAALVVVKPERSFIGKQEKEAEKKLRKLEKTLTAQERQAIRDKVAKMEAMQNTPDTPEQLATIPHLSVKDLSRTLEVVPRETYDCESGGVPALVHRLFTNGITYFDLGLPLDALPPEDYLWLPLFARVVTSIGVSGKNYGEMSSLLARTAGNLSTVLRSCAVVERDDKTPPDPVLDRLDVRGRDWLIFRMKMLDEKIAPSLDLLLQLITDANFNDTRRLRDLVLEMKNEADSSVAPSGNYYALARSGIYLSRGWMMTEIWQGIAQLQFVHSLLNLSIDEIKQKLISIRETLLAKSGLLVNITGESIPAALRAVKEKFASFGPVRKREENAVPAGQFYPLFNRFGGAPPVAEPGGKIEVFSSPSMRTGFTALSFPAAAMTAKRYGAEQLLSHRLSTGALWEQIRMRGGAYGVHAQANALEQVFSFCTYRDPVPSRSLALFPQILEYEASQVLDRDTIEKMIIGVYSQVKLPTTSVEKGFADFTRVFSNIDSALRQKCLERILDTTARDLAAVAAEAGKRCLDGTAVIIAGEQIAGQAAESLGVALTRLPV
ncbi:MAG: insulinase family protein [Spirochaetaceae bacterium]|nr:insulinase family protein [Spirochaetaceae bacterium]